MERSVRKRNKVDKAGDDKDGKKSGKAEQEEPQPPSEEEVDEFFTILKRMRVAVKYFKDNNKGDESGGDGRRNENRPTLGAAAAGAMFRDDRGFDLNSVPLPEND